MKLESWPTAVPSTPPESSSQALDRWVSAASDAWRQEMEKAQSEGWFHPVVESTSNMRRAIDWLARDSAPGDAAGVVSTSSIAVNSEAAGVLPHQGLLRSTEVPDEHAGRLSLSGDAAEVKVPRPKGLVSYRAALTDTTSPPVPATGHTAPRPAPLVAVWGLVSEQAPEANETLAPIDLSGPGSASARAATALLGEPPPPLRVHVEGDARTATVWLGVDAAIRPQVLALQHALAQWLSHSGYRSLRWVCNGAPLAAPPLTASAEPADASAALAPSHQRPRQGLADPNALFHPSGES